jgi:hypothetical protein
MKSFVIILFTVCCSGIIAQNNILLEGTVLDRETKAPVPNAMVYLDGTSIASQTDRNGKYLLFLKNIINTRLIVSCISYKKVIISNPYDKLHRTVYLDLQAIRLNEVVISAKHKSKYSRNQLLTAFKKQFLGYSKAGKSCKILNEDSLSLIYDSQNRTLAVSSPEPVEIENKHLGYRIFWEIEELKIQYGKNVLNEENSIIYNKGMVRFEDLTSNDSKTIARREEMYEKSSERFFNLLAEKKIKESHDSSQTAYQTMMSHKNGVNDINYSFFKNRKPYSVEQIFTVYDNPSGNGKKTIVINREECDGEEITVTVYLFFRKGKAVESFSSPIVFSTDTIQVDLVTNTVEPMGKILVLGDMGMQRVGDMLPLDYSRDEDDEK